MPQAIATLVLSVVFGSCANLAQRKLALARRIAVEPSLIYWAHPTILRQRIAGGTIDTTFIKLHRGRHVARRYGCNGRVASFTQCRDSSWFLRLCSLNYSQRSRVTMRCRKFAPCALLLFLFASCQWDPHASLLGAGVDFDVDGACLDGATPGSISGGVKA